MNSMYDRVKAYIEKNCMLEGIGRVVVGLSGGADSVCLLLMLKKFDLILHLILFLYLHNILYMLLL